MFRSLAKVQHFGPDKSHSEKVSTADYNSFCTTLTNVSNKIVSDINITRKECRFMKR